MRKATLDGIQVINLLCPVCGGSCTTPDGSTMIEQTHTQVRCQECGEEFATPMECFFLQPDAHNLWQALAIGSGEALYGNSFVRTIENEWAKWQEGDAQARSYSYIPDITSPAKQAYHLTYWQLESVVLFAHEKG